MADDNRLPLAQLERRKEQGRIEGYKRVGPLGHESSAMKFLLLSSLLAFAFAVSTLDDEFKQKMKQLNEQKDEFGSVMHYAENDFARDRSRPTIVAKNGYERFQHSMSNYLPTFYDIKLINTYYKCYDVCPRKISCQNGGLQDVNNCNRCKCPPGFNGVNCEAISTSGCDRSYTIGSSPFNISATAGSSGLYSVAYNECAIHLKPATKGRRLEVTVTTGSGMSSWNCYGAGVDVRMAADPAMAGIRICRPNTRFPPIYSDSDRMVLNLFSRVNYVSFTFTARMI